jgi:hypothetical protein
VSDEQKQLPNCSSGYQSCSRASGLNLDFSPDHDFAFEFDEIVVMQMSVGELVLRLITRIDSIAGI